MPNSLNIIIEQANSAILSRDYEFAEKILLTQLNKPQKNSDEYYTLKNILGKLYIRSGDIKKGLEIYKELNSIKPNNVDILNNMGVIYRRLNLFNESVVILEKAKAIDSKNETTLYNLGNTYKQKGDYKNAIQCLIEVLEIKPDDALAYNHLGYVYCLCKDYQKAFGAYKMGLKVDPNHPFLNFNLAELYQKQEKFNEAIISYQTALKTKPNWYEALIAIADCYVKINDLRKAIDTYKIIIDSNGSSENNFTKIAELYEKNNEAVYAENFYRKAISLNEYFLPAVIGYSNMLKSQKRYFDAYNLLINNKNKHTDNKELMLSTADVCLMLEDYSKAKEILNNLSKKIKGDKEILKMQGKLFSVIGDTKKAETIFEHLLRLSPSEINLRSELADLYLHNDKYKEAAIELTKYLNEKPQEITARLKLGKAYEHMQKYDLAKNEYNKIIKNDAKNTDALAAILELNKKEGNAVEAVRLANKIVDIQTDSNNSDNISSLSESVQLYEDAVHAYGNNSILNKNLEKLIPPQEEFDMSLESAINELGESNIEDNAEITLSNDFETIPDLEMPFDDLIELGDDEMLERSEDENALENLVYVDTPIDDSPNLNDGYETFDFNHSDTRSDRKNNMLEEEIQLKDTSTSETDIASPHSKYQTPSNDHNEQQAAFAYQPENPETISTSLSPEEKIYPNLQNLTADKPIQKEFKPSAENSLIDEAPINSSNSPLEEINMNPDELLFDELSSPILSQNPYMTALPHSLKKSPQFEKELEIIENYEIVKLFVYLRDLMDNLPSIELKDFLISNERIQMEYVINKLSGDVGLKRRMILINVKESIKKTINPKNTTDKTLKDVLGYLRIVATQLPDKGFAAACITKINNLIKQIE